MLVTYIESGLSISFESPVVLIFTPETNLLLFGGIVSTIIGYLAHNIKDQSSACIFSCNPSIPIKYICPVTPVPRCETAHMAGTAGNPGVNLHTYREPGHQSHWINNQ